MLKFKNIELHQVFSMFIEQFKNKFKNIEAQIGEIPSNQYLVIPSLGGNFSKDLKIF